MNPIPETKPYKMATLRQSLMAPDSWDGYGVETLSDFDVRPTYKYTTPHNIIKWTKRTIVDSLIDSRHPDCAQACHIIKDSEGNLRTLSYSGLRIPITPSSAVGGRLYGRFAGKLRSRSLEQQ